MVWRRKRPSAADRRNIFKIVVFHQRQRNARGVIQIEEALGDVPWEVRFVESGGTEERLWRGVFQKRAAGSQHCAVGHVFLPICRQRSPIEVVIRWWDRLEMREVEQPVQRPAVRERIAAIGFKSVPKKGSILKLPPLRV